MAVLPELWNSCIRCVFTDLDLSSSVSVPTSSRPMLSGAILYLSRRFCTAAEAGKKKKKLQMKRLKRTKENL
jgi:hypothetical protein